MLPPWVDSYLVPFARQGPHRVYKQLLAGLPDALQGHIHILLAREAIHTVIQGVRHSFCHLQTQREGNTLRNPLLAQMPLHIC